MRLYSFQIKNFKSIIDTGECIVSELDNVVVLAGQNESGKSSLLRALSDFERGIFDADSVPFSIESNQSQSVSCTYKVEDGDDFPRLLSDNVVENYGLQISDDATILDHGKISKIKFFTLTRIKEKDGMRTELDAVTFNLFSLAILEKPQQPTIANEDVQPTTDSPLDKEKYINVTDAENSKIADIFWEIAPKLVYFDDFCDLLPDRIYIDDLKAKKIETSGYRAVKNLETILGADFVSKNDEADPVRQTKEDRENKELSINFQKDWGQRIHGENKVTVTYDFQKRDGAGNAGSYINFYVITKEGQRLPPKQRSKGMIWFLSLWLELKAQDVEHNSLILLLDEPDQHLHVKAQKDVLRLINRLANKTDDGNGDQIIYATHSPYLIEVERLNRIKLILNTEDQGTKVEDIVTSKIDTDYKRDALQPIADAIGLNVSEFSVLGQKNVILEGLSDFYYFSGMKKILKHDGDYHFVPGIGVRKINSLISLSIGYGLDWIAIIDDDPAEGGKDSKNKLDEISDFVFDGDETKTKEKIYILKGIVGIENMFTHDDLKLIDTGVARNADKVKAIGKKRKVLFSKLFFEKVNAGEITAAKLSKTSKNNFEAAFNFIEQNYSATNKELQQK